jgi:hypothetical protein
VRFQHIGAAFQDCGVLFSVVNAMFAMRGVTFANVVVPFECVDPESALRGAAVWKNSKGFVSGCARGELVAVGVWRRNAGFPTVGVRARVGNTRDKHESGGVESVGAAVTPVSVCVQDVDATFAGESGRCAKVGGTVRTGNGSVKKVDGRSQL